MEVPFWRCDWSDCRYLVGEGEEPSNPCMQGRMDVKPMMMMSICIIIIAGWGDVEATVGLFGNPWPSRNIEKTWICLWLVAGGQIVVTPSAMAGVDLCL